ncbi:hypothetical protein AVEN_233507-1, partial [Araneus ventricosus]
IRHPSMVISLKRPHTCLSPKAGLERMDSHSRDLTADELIGIREQSSTVEVDTSRHKSTRKTNENWKLDQKYQFS